MPLTDMVIVPGDPLATLANADGYYECPRGQDGRRLGPLVGYAGTYKGPGGKPLQFVGDVYVNFAMGEQYPHLLDHFSQLLAGAVPDGLEFDVCLGAPMGGILLAASFGFIANSRMIFAEKKIIALATSDKREQSELVISRHPLNSGDRVVLVEDVCNNFSTTDKMVELAAKAGAKVAAIACFLNRSERTEYQVSGGDTLAILAVVHKPFPQYQQDDPEAAADIVAGNVVWKPKNEWPRLKTAMEAARQG